MNDMTCLQRTPGDCHRTQHHVTDTHPARFPDISERVLPQSTACKPELPASAPQVTLRGGATRRSSPTGFPSIWLQGRLLVYLHEGPGWKSMSPSFTKHPTTCPHLQTRGHPAVCGLYRNGDSFPFNRGRTGSPAQRPVPVYPVLQVRQRMSLQTEDEAAAAQMQMEIQPTESYASGSAQARTALSAPPTADHGPPEAWHRAGQPCERTPLGKQHAPPSRPQAPTPLHASPLQVRPDS